MPPHESDDGSDSDTCLDLFENDEGYSSNQSQLKKEWTRCSGMEKEGQLFFVVEPNQHYRAKLVDHNNTVIKKVFKGVLFRRDDESDFAPCYAKESFVHPVTNMEVKVNIVKDIHLIDLMLNDPDFNKLKY